MKLALAPMATLSHEALRLLIHRYADPDEYYSEMIHAPSYIAGGKFEPFYARRGPVPERMVWQITGPEAGPIARAAALLAPLGGLGLDLNMGCSAPDIARHGAGIAWMLKDVAETAAMVRLVRKTLDGTGFAKSPDGGPFRLGIKIRLGAEENFTALLSFCRAMEGEGVTQITLHPRTKSEKYGRPARWRLVAELARALPLPVYGNGDVFSAADALELEKAWGDSGIAGLMIGRGAVTKPWIFRDIILARGGRRAAGAGGGTDREAAGTPHGDSAGEAGAHAARNAPHGPVQPPAPASTLPPIDHLEVARFFLETLKTSQPPEFQLSRARRFFFYYCDNFAFAHHVKMKAQNTKTPDEIGGLLESYFGEVPKDRYLYF